MEEKSWVLSLNLGVSKNTLIIGNVGFEGKKISSPNLGDEIEAFISEKVDDLYAYIKATPFCNHVSDREWVEDFNSFHKDIVVRILNWNELLELGKRGFGSAGGGGGGGGGGSCG